MRKWKWVQWKDPIRLLFRGSGLVIWKVCGVNFPTFDFFLGEFCHFGYSINRTRARFYLHLKL